MRSFLIGLVCLAVVGELVQAGVSSPHAEWLAYKLKHGKSYASQAEDASRMANFLLTKERVERHNAKSGQSYEKGLNHLSDWSDEERAKLNGFRLGPKGLYRSEAQLAETEAYMTELLGGIKSGSVPDEVDWRKVPGRVGPVGYQGHCGSCWTFSTVGLLEGQEAVRNVTTTKVISLSEQEVLDCSHTNNMGCMGGSMEYALEDIADMGGIEKDADYPYTGHPRACRFDKKKVVMTDSGSVMVPPKDEDKLKQLVATYGPVSIALFATKNLVEYTEGILDDSICVHTKKIEEQLNHALVIVGYGTDPKLGDYWIVKNSWGANWGENGYVRVKRGVNMCGIALVPIIAKFK